MSCRKDLSSGWRRSAPDAPGRRAGVVARSLEELSETEEFRRMVERRISQPGPCRVRSGQPAKISHADGRVAGFGGRRRVLGQAGADERNRALRAAAGRNNSRQAAVLRHGHDARRRRRRACSLKRISAGRPKSKEIPIIRRAAARPVRCIRRRSWSSTIPIARRRAAIGPGAHLGRRSRRNPASGRATAERPRRGLAAAHRVGRVADASRSLWKRCSRQFPEAKWHVYEPLNRDAAYQARSGHSASRSFPGTISRAPTSIVSLDADFLVSGPGHLRHARRFHGTAAIADRKIGRSPAAIGVAGMNRLYVSKHP